MITISQNYTAVAVNIGASFLASGGAAPYIYTVQGGGAGGSINPNTGVYIAPAVAQSGPNRAYDVIRATANDGEFGTTSILVGSPLLLFCDVIEHEMQLADGRVYIFDQKINQPSDYDLYIAISVPICRPFGNTNKMISTDSGLMQFQYVNMQAMLDIDIISRGPAALERKEEVILALNSIYAEQQMEANSFYIAKLPPNSKFINLSDVDGAAIPFRFKISTMMQYAVSKSQPVSYFDTFSPVELTTNV